MAWNGIFESFEPKSIAYIFLFYALNDLLEHKYSRTGMFLAISTYFHILVGGWFLVALLIYLALNRKFKEAFKTVLFYSLICLPFAIYLFNGYFLNPSPETEINLDWVYVYYRLPHHLGIF